MVVQDTSVEAYVDARDVRVTQEWVVLDCIDSHPCGVCDLCIHEETGVPVHLVSARRNDLIKQGRVCQSYGYIIYKGRRRKCWYSLEG